MELDDLERRLAAIEDAKGVPRQFILVVTDNNKNGLSIDELWARDCPEALLRPDIPRMVVHMEGVDSGL